MLIAATIIFVISALASVVLGSVLRLSLKREAPQLYEKVWQKSFGSHSVRTKMVLPFAMMIYMRGYRQELAAYPASRAWASWLFANCWLQLVAFALMIIAVLVK